MLKKSLSVLASSLLIAGVASATELYNQDGTTFSVGGRLDIGYQTATNKKNDHGLYDGQIHTVNGQGNGSRINFGGTRQINDDLKAFGLAEWGFDPNVSGGAYWNNRLGYAGFEHTTAGKVAFGKLWGVYYDVAGFTDQFIASGGDAHYITKINDFKGDFSGLTRATSALRYDKKLGPVALGLQYQTQENGDGIVSRDYINRKYSFGASVVADVATGVKVGVASNYLAVTDKMNEAMGISRNASMSSNILGVSYTSDMFDFALTGSYTINNNAGTNKSDTIGQEAYIGIKPIAQTLAYVGNNFQTTSYSDDLAGNKKDSTTEQNYVSVGAKYFFSKQATVGAEYKYDLRNKDTIAKSKNGVNGSQVSARIQYYF
ncbi:MAG: porin [Alphaproteobacteria bacterium]|jgi:predicted porin|nr:porin [Alphaproteobacteria bacterium]